MLRRFLLAVAFAFAVSPAFAADILVIIDLQMQTMHVRVDGITRYRWEVSTGRSGYDTPPGRYQPTRMYKSYFSREYDNAPMPFSIFFHQGYAIHGTTDLRNLGRVASHGCVRLHPENAATLFALVRDTGVDNTVIRVRTRHATMAVVEEAPKIPLETASARPIDAAAQATPDLMIDEVTTGSAAMTSIPWLRRGVNS